MGREIEELHAHAVKLREELDAVIDINMVTVSEIVRKYDIKEDDLDLLIRMVVESYFEIFRLKKQKLPDGRLKRWINLSVLLFHLSKEK